MAHEDLRDFCDKVETDTSGAFDSVHKRLAVALKSSLEEMAVSPWKYKPSGDRIELRGFVLDRDSGSCFDNGVQVYLTPRQFALAWVLFSEPSRYLSRKEISETVWGIPKDIAGRTIERMCICCVRNSN